MERQVSLLMLFKLIINKKPFGGMGLMFTFTSLFLILPFTIIITDSLSESYQKYDYEEILANGVYKKAVVTEVSAMTNVSVNGEHPQLITFEYEDTNGNATDRFETFDLDKAMLLKSGDTVAIKAYQGQAVLMDLEPFTFPFYVFYILPAVFFVLGSIFLSIALLPALKIYKLYKNGVVKQGVVTSLVANAGLPISGRGRKVFVDYYYTNRNDKKIYGSATTNDFSILGEKKAGDPIKILVSPDDEDDSCLFPEKEAAKRGWSLR